MHLLHTLVAAAEVPLRRIQSSRRSRAQGRGTSRRRTFPSLLPVALTVLLVSVGFAWPASAMAGTPVSIPFPRLAVWWPENHTQPLADRARYDYLQLQNSDADHIAELRAAHPDILLLNAGNARELNYVRSNYNSPLNVELRSASTDWMITQAGSTITAGISGSTTSIPVADGTKFAAGEMCLIDHELVYINSVSSNTLNVIRGEVTPAVSHTSGTRIASTVGAWPGTIEMDNTTTCRRVDVGHGPETWAEWNVRRGYAAVVSADWDGLIIDCCDKSPGNWIPNWCRSIDQNRDNVPDDPDALNTAWNNGLDAYIAALRAAVGPDRIIVGNSSWVDPNMNGRILERYPTATTTLVNWKTRILEYPGYGYLEWLERGASPNLTTMMTFGSQTNYQLMRYGLTTALMGDGFFSYEEGGTGHGWLGLYWFDEFDNAGTSRGYLGQPLGSAVSAGTNVWRRDYQGGVALVNPDTVAHTVSLGGTFRKIRGVQAPSVNDGSLVTEVTLQPRDGIILLRTTDILPPTTTLLAGTAAPARWYNAPVSLTLSASDSGSGVLAVYLERGAGTETVQSGFSFTLSGEGDRTLRYWAKDKVGNIEAAKTTKVGVDLTAPTVTSNAASTPYVDSAVIEISATDGLSGVAAYEYQVDGGTVQTGHTVTLHPSSYPRSYQLSYRAQDVAGNWSAWSAAKTIAVTQPATEPPGQPALPAHLPLHRFYNVRTGTHFYTASESEKNTVLGTLSSIYRYEGVSYYVSQSASEGTAVHRFYNKRTGTHFYTASEDEKNVVIATLGGTFAYEGVAFYASPSAATGTITVYRFYNRRTGTHFYTASEDEKNFVIATLSGTYSFEGGAYFAWSR